MSSDREPDLADYVTDNSAHEEGTLFLPTQENGDPWTFLPGGILVALAGGVLAPLSVQLAGALIALGYGLAAITLRRNRSCFAKALRFGFGVTAILGAALLAAGIASPEAVRHAVVAPGHHLTMFLGFAAMPWALGALRLLYGLVSCLWRPKRIANARAASSA